MMWGKWERRKMGNRTTKRVEVPLYIYGRSTNLITKPVRKNYYPGADFAGIVLKFVMRGVFEYKQSVVSLVIGSILLSL